MRYAEIAMAKPFEGKPQINLAGVYGASPGMPFLLRIPVTGQRPVSCSVDALPAGLTLEGNIISGCIASEGDYTVTIAAENALGRCEKQVTLEIHPHRVLLTPLLGFTSWNAFGSAVSQEKMIGIARRMMELGICEYGYSYINTDSGWQLAYGGKHDAIMPNAKFPDMKQMTDEIHAMGLKCGIYSTPMLTAWGCPEELPSIPGCTQGEPDPRFADINGGIGVIHKEAGNVRQWAEWGFDYLKYDWRPCDTYNADLMYQELLKANRDFGYCITVHAFLPYCFYWSRVCNSYRCNTDAHGYWDNLLRIYPTYEPFADHVCKGHFFDMDMLDVGSCRHPGQPPHYFTLTEDEQLLSYTMRAFFSSPLQISSSLVNISDFELSMYCNDEIIAINQDTRFDPARRDHALEPACGSIHVYKRQLADGSTALAVFNVGETEEDLVLRQDQDVTFRDVWAKKDLCTATSLALHSYPHTVRVLKLTQE